MIKRMSAGRVRVKSNVDLDTAKRLATDLEKLGARCSIIDDVGQALERGTWARAPSSSEVPAERPVRALSHPGVPAQEHGVPAQEHGVQDPGASAQEHGGQDLGVLASGAALSVATLDGEEDRRGQQVQAVAQYSDADFAPPEVSGQTGDLQLAIDVKHKPAPPPDAQYDEEDDGPAQIHSAVPPAGDAEAASGKAAAGENPVQKIFGTLADSWRIRFAAGVFLALLIGFLPAHFISSMRESSAFEKIDKEVATEHAQIEDRDDWLALDETRAHLLERKQSQHTNIALTGIFLWGLGGAGIGYLWFRRIDWDRFSRPG